MKVLQTLFVVAGLLGTGAAAQDVPFASTPSKDTRSFVVKPHLLDSEKAGSVALALDYDFSLLKVLGGTGKTSQGKPEFTEGDAHAAIDRGELAFRARGTIASSKAKNPNKMVDFAGSAVYRLSLFEAYLRGGVQLAWETDQSLENRQFVYSLLGSISKVGTIVNGDAGSLLLGYGRVNVQEDKAREALGIPLEDYRRWSAELSYSLPMNMRRFRSVDFNYRAYAEVSPPAAVRAAGLHRHRLGLVRLNLDQDFFVQYSRGSLPFDEKSARAVKIGWEYKLE